PFWVKQWPEILQYSRTIRQRAYSLLEYIDQMLLELEMQTVLCKWNEWWNSLDPKMQEEVERHRRAVHPESQAEAPEDTQEHSGTTQDAEAQGKYQGDARRHPRRVARFGNGGLIN